MHGRVAEDGAGHMVKLSTELGTTNHINDFFGFAQQIANAKSQSFKK